MGRYARGWALIKASGEILKQDPKLVIFPLLSFLALVGIFISLMVPFLVDPSLARTVEQGGQGRTLGYVFLFLFYLATNFVMVFFNVALVSCVMKRLAGETPTLGGGLAAAMTRLPQIGAWAAVAATVGMI